MAAVNPIGIPHVPLSRRRFLQVGGLAGLSLLFPAFIDKASATTQPLNVQAPHYIAPITANGRDPGTSLILIVLQGGASHFDTFDPREPNTDAQTKGPFDRISTNARGIYITEPFQRLSKLMDKVSVVRNLYHDNSDHTNATSLMFTGSPEKINQSDFYSDSRHTSPLTEFSEHLSRTGSSEIGYVVLHNNNGMLYQNRDGDVLERPFAGVNSRDQQTMFIPYTNGEYHSPFDGDTNLPRYRERRGLLVALESTSTTITPSESPAMDRFMTVRELAHSRLDGNFRTAFNLNLEPARVRDKYGRNPFGEGLLLARRMVQRGARVAVVTDGNYDHHTHIEQNLMRLLPRLDQGLSALIEEKEMLDLPIVIGVVSEFGRTPRLNNGSAAFRFSTTYPPGRDHWSASNTMLLAGEGIEGGQVIGETQNNGSIRGNALDARLVGETLLNKIGFARYVMRGTVRTNERFPSLQI
jgi:hypothetical protein